MKKEALDHLEDCKDKVRVSASDLAQISHSARVGRSLCETSVRRPLLITVTFELGLGTSLGFTCAARPELDWLRRGKCILGSFLYALFLLCPADMVGTRYEDDGTPFEVGSGHTYIASAALFLLGHFFPEYACAPLMSRSVCSVTRFVLCAVSQVMDKLAWSTKKGELLLALGRHEEAEQVYR